MQPTLVTEEDVQVANLKPGDYGRIVYAADQPEYLPLPVVCLAGDHGMVVSCWSLTWRERLRVLFTGRLYISILTFRKALQPIMPSTTFKGLFIDPF